MKVITSRCLFLIYLLPVFFLGIFIDSYLNNNKDSDCTDCLFSDGINIRGGIPNTKKKILKGQPINVVYFGGSITQMDGWRNKTTEWLQNTFTNSIFREYNSCISGSGSYFGVYRLEEDVINYSPDIVFVEFAVNDSISDHYIDGALKNNFIEILSRIKSAKPDSDIVLIYTISKKMLTFYNNRKLYSSAKKMEEIAAKFNIPSINFGFRTSFLWQHKLLRFDINDNFPNYIPLFSRDGVHPEQYGHEIYTSVMKDFFKMALDDSYNDNICVKIDSFPFKTHRFVNINNFLFTPKLNEKNNVKMNYGKDSMFSKTNLWAYVWNSQELNIKTKASTFGMVISMPPGSYSYEAVIDNISIIKPKFFHLGSANPRLFYSEFDIPNDQKFHNIKITHHDNIDYNLIFLLTDGEVLDN